MVCSEWDEKSVRNPNDVLTSPCAYLRKYREPTHSNIMKELKLMSVSNALWNILGPFI